MLKSFRLALLMLALPAAAVAAGPATAPTSAPSAAGGVIAVYPIRDLIEPIPDFRDEDGMGPPTVAGLGYSYSGGGGGRSIPSEADPEVVRRELVDTIIQRLQSTVDGQSWTDNGGGVGSIKEVNGELVITQTAENQRRVKAVLSRLRDAVPTVQVEAVWATLAAADLAAADTFQKRDELVATLDPATPRAQISCRDGQAVHLASGPASSIIFDLTPVVAQNAVGFDPTVVQVQTGGHLEFRPVLRTIVAGEPAASAILTVRSTLSRFDAPPEQIRRPIIIPEADLNVGRVEHVNPVGDSPGGDFPGGLDRLQTSVARLKTSLIVPVGHWAVVGGMTPDAGADKPGVTQVYLIVRLTVPQ